MQELERSYPETWHELQNGNISVMNSDIPFVSIGADHACEQVNRMMINSTLIDTYIHTYMFIELDGINRNIRTV